MSCLFFHTESIHLHLIVFVTDALDLWEVAPFYSISSWELKWSALDDDSIITVRGQFYVNRWWGWPIRVILFGLHREMEEVCMIHWTISDSQVRRRKRVATNSHWWSSVFSLWMKIVRSWMNRVAAAKQLKNLRRFQERCKLVNKFTFPANKSQVSVLFKWNLKSITLYGHGAREIFGCRPCVSSYKTSDTPRFK